MILARKNGWLIAVTVVRQTRSGTHVKPIDSDVAFFVSRNDRESKICGDVAEATAFVKA